METLDWKEAARNVASKLSESRFPRELRKRIHSVDTLAVACSGGADSIATLLAVFGFFEKKRPSTSLKVFHFDHKLRGEASLQDAEFVTEVCRGLGVELIRGEAQWPEGQQVTEENAREVRLAFFRQALGDGRDALILTGHHAGDILETSLMRLSRGAGVDGLCAPRAISEAGGGLVFGRPLLEFSKEEIYEALREAKVPWKEDQSNFSDGNYRARLRQKTIPQWREAADRPLEPGVCRSRRLLEEDASALQEWTSQAFEQSVASPTRVELSKLSPFPRAIQRRVLTSWLDKIGLSAASLDQLLDCIDEGEAFTRELAPGLQLEIAGNWLEIVKNADEEKCPLWEPFRLPPGCVAFLPDGAKVVFEELSPFAANAWLASEEGGDDSKSVVLKGLSKQCASMLVRRRRPGDAFKPHGKSSPKKLKSLLIDKKIKREERDRLPVFEQGEAGIVWMPGLPPCADLVLDGQTKTALRLTYER